MQQKTMRHLTWTILVLEVLISAANMGVGFYRLGFTQDHLSALYSIAIGILMIFPILTSVRQVQRLSLEKRIGDWRRRA